MPQSMTLNDCPLSQETITRCQLYDSESILSNYVLLTQIALRKKSLQMKYFCGRF